MTTGTNLHYINLPKVHRASLGPVWNLLSSPEQCQFDRLANYKERKLPKAYCASVGPDWNLLSSSSSPSPTRKFVVGVAWQFTVSFFLLHVKKNCHVTYRYIFCDVIRHLTLVSNHHRDLTSRVKMYVPADAHPWGGIKLLRAPPPTPSGLISY
jgi:hypothetical protein